MRKKIRRFVVVLGMSLSLGLGAGEAAQAAGAVTGKIVEILKYTTSPHTYIKFDASPTGSPGCQAHPSYHFILTTGTDEGKQVYGALLSAYLAGRTVQAYGKGVCDLQGNIETLQAGALK